MTLNSEYRVVINKNLTFDPGFFSFLKLQFHTVLYTFINQRHVDLEQTYRFTIYSVPAQWDSFVLSTIKLAEAGLTSLTDKQEKIANILLDLNPLDPKPVEIEFTLGEIVRWIDANVKLYTEMLPGTGLIYYFGISQLAWFDDYPVQTGIVLRAVDCGTLDNFPLHLFDTTFQEIRAHLLDFFAMYNNGEMPDVHIPTLEVGPDDNTPIGGQSLAPSNEVESEGSDANI